MKNELKKAIISFIFDNENEFQLRNAASRQFRNYIYDDKGAYLIGGEEVSTFIDEAIKLINTN